MKPRRRWISYDNFSSGYRRTESGKYVAWIESGEEYQRTGSSRDTADAAIADIRELRERFKLDRYEEQLRRYREKGPVDPADAGKRFALLVDLLCRIGLEKTAGDLIFPWSDWSSFVRLLRGALADKRTVALNGRERCFLRACIRWGIRNCAGRWRLPMNEAGELSLRALAGESLSRKLDHEFPGWDATDAEVHSLPPCRR